MSSSVKATHVAFSCSEIEEEEEEEDSSRDLFGIDTKGRRPRSLTPVVKGEEYHHRGYVESGGSSDLFSLEAGPNDGEDDHSLVYVGVWRSTSTNKIDHDQDQVSMDALLWTLNNLTDHVQPIHPPPPLPGRRGDGDHLSSSSSTAVAATSTTVVYLIHVFPELRYIPTPLGKLPLSQANPEQKESFMIQERIKRRDFLQKFLDLCSASKVRVETILIESDMEAKAILDLIPILNIKRLVLGTSKSSLRKMRSKRGSGTVDEILKRAPDFCEVKVICEGKEVSEDQLIVESPIPSPRANVSSSPRATPPPPPPPQDHITDTFTCGCFKPKVMS